MEAYLHFARILILAVAINVALSESDLCSTSVQDECRFHEKVPKDFPETVSDLKQICDDFQEITRCYLNYFDTCGEHPLDTPEFRKFTKYIQENCQENSDAFQLISSNFECFMSTVKSLDKECRIDLFEELEFEELMTLSGITYENLESMHCILAMAPIKCKSLLMEKRCGSELGEVLSDILKNTEHQYIHYCSAEVLAGLSLFEEAIDVAISERKWMEPLDNDEN